MRIAIPVAGETVASPLGDAEGFRFYEDDHGRIVRQFLVPMEERSTKAAIDLLERYGIDALLCGTIDENERIGGSDAFSRLCRRSGRGRAAFFKRQHRFRPE